MSISTARSAPCPCGSGLKYKRCHGSEFPPEGSEKHVAWSRLRVAINSLPTVLLRFAKHTFGPYSVREAFEEFLVWGHVDVDNVDPATFDGIFSPWYLYSWSPDPADTVVRDASLYGRAPASAWLERDGRTASPLVREYVEACLNTAFSFHEVVGRPGRPGITPARHVHAGGARCS